MSDNYVIHSIGYQIVHCIMMMCALQAVVCICHMGHQMNVPRIK